MAILAEYAAYLVMGAGVLLVLISLIYTYRVDRKMKIRYFENRPLNRGRGKQTSNQSKQLLDNKREMKNLNQNMDKLIDELRDKETEVRILINRIKDWDTKGAEKGFSNILKQKIDTEELDTPVNKREKEIPEEPVIQNDAFAKNEEIIKLANEGLSITEIAQKLNLGYREVELIVKLKQKGARTGA